MSTTRSTLEIQRFYEINSSLNLAQDMAEVLLSLQATLALHAVAIAHVALTGGARLEHVLMGDGRQSTPNEALDFSLTTGIDPVEFIPKAAAPAPIAVLMGRYDAQSAAQLAVKIEGAVTDALYVFYDNAEPPDEMQMRLLEAFASQTGIILENQRLLGAAADYAERLSRQVRVLETLNTLANSVGRGLDEQEVMAQTLQTLVATTEADHAGIVLIDPDGKMGTVVSEYPIQGAVGLRIEREGNPIFTELLAGRATPFLINDIESNSQITPLVRQLLTGIGTKSIIIAPLNVNGQLIGSVGLDLYTTDRQFQPDVVELVSTLTNQLAIYMQDARARHEREESAHQAQVLDSISSRLIALNSVDDLMQEAVRSLTELLDAKRVIIRLGTPDAERAAG
jgi:GAF domain-containing protein